MAKHRPTRVRLVVHVGDASDEAVLVEWWKPLDSDVETRSVKFYEDDKDLWLDDDVVPSRLRVPGVRFSDVEGTERFGGLANPLVQAGYRLHLQPEPAQAGAPQPVAVLSDDREKVGYLPSDVAAATMDEARRQRSVFGALVVSEERDAESAERLGIRILVGPGRIWAEESKG